MKTFYAKWSGKCAACGETFPAGTEVRYEGAALVETSCGMFEGAFQPEPEWPREKPAPPLDRSKLCPSCFTVHGPGQRECS